MKSRNAKFIAVLGLLLFSCALPALAAPRCSTASGAGDWAYSYSGTILLQTGPVPVVNVGRFTALANGTFSDTQTRSIGGDVGVETVTGTFHEKADCTVTYTANVYQGGVLLRTATDQNLHDLRFNPGRGAVLRESIETGTDRPRPHSEVAVHDLLLNSKFRHYTPVCN